MKYIPQ